jgi:hypothetical protein
LLIVHTDAKAGLDFERFVPSGDLLGFYVQPLADIAGTLFLRSSFFGDVRGNDNFRSIGELKKGGIAGVTRNAHLHHKRSQNEQRAQPENEG